MHLSRTLLLILGLCALAACGGGSSTPADPPGPTTYVYKGTQSPGDVWTYTIVGSTFTARNETLGHDYRGDVSPR